MCAFRPPVAPPNLPVNGIASNSASCPSMRSTNTMISLPTRVGVAAWPCVLASMVTSSYSMAMARIFLSTPSRSVGRYTCSTNSLVASGIAVLLTSCDVRPKWTNSRYSDRPMPSMADFTKYSMALTSWFVTRSVALIVSASATLKSVYTARRALFWAAVRATPESSGRAPNSAMKYSISTRTRYLCKLDSEK